MEKITLGFPDNISSFHVLNTSPMDGMSIYLLRMQYYLVGGFNPFEKYLSKWIICPRFGVKIKKNETTT